MAWLKIDDGFPTHAKILALPRNDRWTWLEVLAYCARHREDRGKLPPALTDVVPKATKAFILKAESAGLLERNGDGCYHVHGWSIHNGETIEEKVRAYLDEHPDATANEVVRKVGGNRQQVIAEYKRQTEGGS